jgi:DNA end-binding protein Ku
MKAIWKGNLVFGLVSIPIKLVSAITEHELSFKSLCGDCKVPLITKRFCYNCQKEIGYKNIKKGYQLSRHEYVIIEDKDLQKIKLKTTHSIELIEFISREKIHSIFFNKAYYMTPDEGGIKPYYLLLKVLKNLNRVAIGKICFRNKEHIVCIEPYLDNLLLMHTLFYKTEIKKVEEELVSYEPKESELNLAYQLVDSMTTEEFLPQKYKDEYTQSLKKLILEKTKGKILPKEEELIEEEEEHEEVTELEDILKASIKQRQQKCVVNNLSS